MHCRSRSRFSPISSEPHQSSARVTKGTEHKVLLWYRYAPGSSIAESRIPVEYITKCANTSYVIALTVECYIFRRKVPGDTAYTRPLKAASRKHCTLSTALKLKWPATGNAAARRQRPTA